MSLKCDRKAERKTIKVSILKYVLEKLPCLSGSVLWEPLKGLSPSPAESCWHFHQQSSVCVKTMYQTHPRNTVSSTYFPWWDREWQHSRHTSNAKTPVAKDVWPLMFRRKRPLYRAAMANQPFCGQDGTLEWEPITTTSCPSGRSVYFITMPSTVLSVWKHFHMLLKTTCLDCRIKINNDDVDSQKHLCVTIPKS